MNRLLPGGEVEFKTPPPMPIQSEAQIHPPRPTVPIPVWNEIHAIFIYVNRLQQNAIFAGPEIRRLAAMLQTLKEHIQMPLGNILEQVPAVKPRSRATLEQLRAYCVEVGLPSDDGDGFHDKMLQYDWKVDGKPVKDVYATIRNWKRLGCMPSQIVASKVNRNGAVWSKSKGWTIDKEIAQLKKEGLM
jgi:hypothetical protein